MGIASIKIQNFKSIREADIELGKLNILIGANGAGKSNFIGFFKFLKNLYDENLRFYVSKNGRAENFLYFGSKKSKFLSGKVILNNNYKSEFYFKLEPDLSGNFIFSDDRFNLNNDDYKVEKWEDLRFVGHTNVSGSQESILKVRIEMLDNHYKDILTFFSTLRTFHFNDTSFEASVKKPANSIDYSFLREDGSNIAAFLYRLQESSFKSFKLIERVVQSVAPFFDKFILKPDEINNQQIFLGWLEKGSDKLFTAHNLSDGTLRFICLATLLLQPELPEIIIIDEPELGLHPFAISKLASMLKIAANTSQVIVSTQSVNLVNEFSADDIIVVDRKDEQSVFSRQSKEKLEHWLENYSLGELWEKNVLGGLPK